jgi:hypothetical protein
VFWEAIGKLMQRQAWIWSCSVDDMLSECGLAFDWDDDGFACSNTMGISKLSLSLYHMTIITLTHFNSQDGKIVSIMKACRERIAFCRFSAMTSSVKPSLFFGVDR